MTFGLGVAYKSMKQIMFQLRKLDLLKKLDLKTVKKNRFAYFLNNANCLNCADITYIKIQSML